MAESFKGNEVIMGKAISTQSDTVGSIKDVSSAPESNVRWNDLTHKEKILGWAVPLLVAAFTIAASYLPGPLGEATRQFFFIHR